MATKRAPVRVLRTGQQLIILALIIILIFLFRGIRGPIEHLFRPGKPTYISSIYANKGKLGLKQPLGIAVDKTNNWLYVTSARNSRVFVLDDNYKLLFTFGEKVLKTPVFVTVNNNGTKVFVTDRAQKSVFVFSPQGILLGKLNLKELTNPLAITVDNDDNLYISDTGRAHQILKYNSQGKLILRFGYKKRAVPITSALGGFFYPNGLAVDSQENIYVGDSNNERIQIFDKSGHFQRLILTGGLPRGIALNEKAKVLFVVDTLRQRINMYDLKSGHLTGTFSQFGNGEEDVAFPNGIVLKGPRLQEVLVVDRENGRLQLYKTQLSITDLINIIRPYTSLWSLPILGFLLLFLVSRRRKYIVAGSFINAVLKDQKLGEMLVATNSYHVSPALYEKITKGKFFEQFSGKIVASGRFSYPFVERIQQERKLSREQAEVLALARHKGIYQPIILASDKKLIETADELGIKTMDLDAFFRSRRLVKPKNT